MGTTASYATGAMDMGATAMSGVYDMGTTTSGVYNMGTTSYTQGMTGMTGMTTGIAEAPDTVYSSTMANGPNVV